MVRGGGGDMQEAFFHDSNVHLAIPRSGARRDKPLKALGGVQVCGGCHLVVSLEPCYDSTLFTLIGTEAHRFTHNFPTHKKRGCSSRCAVVLLG